MKECSNFCNANCSYRCPNAVIEAYDERWGGPAAEDMGLEKVQCRDCHLNEIRCDYCYFHGTKDCPEYKKNYPSSNYFDILD